MSLKRYANRLTKIREAMEAELESVITKIDAAQERNAKQSVIDKLEEEMSSLEDAISTLENLEMEWEA
mgnify:CR=1 FL=1